MVSDSRRQSSIDDVNPAGTFHGASKPPRLVLFCAPLEPGVYFAAAVAIAIALGHHRHGFSLDVASTTLEKLSVSPFW
jgi:hypothetical protein